MVAIGVESVWYWHLCVHFGLIGDVQMLADSFGCFLSCGDNGLAVGKSREQGRDVCLFHHFEIFVGGIVLQSANGRGGVEEGDAFVLAKGYYLVYVEAFACRVDEMVAVAKEDLPFNAPVVVDEIGVIEIHAPPLSLWRKTAEKQHFGFFGKKGDERMVFHIGCASGYVMCVKICHRA